MPRAHAATVDVSACVSIRQANARNAHRFEDRVGRILSQGHDLKATFREQALNSAKKEIVGLSTRKGERARGADLLRVPCGMSPYSLLNRASLLNKGQP